MAKILKAARMEGCIGCALCELLASRLSEERLSYADSFVQIKKAKPGRPYFKAVIDYGKKTDYQVLCDLCPGNCFDIVESK